MDVLAKRFISVDNLDDLKTLIHSEKEFFILGGGSNLLLTKDIETLVVHINIKGISSIKEDNSYVEVTAKAGENWHEFVMWCISKNYGGLENLSLIPGNVGTSPIQNIGAYGVEVKDSITRVHCLEISSGKVVEFTNQACEFAYRNSIFKNKAKSKYIILSVSFRLSKINHNLTTSYGAIENELAAKKISTPTIKDISNAVISIRNSKLPDPKVLGNSGSFFKNPVIKKELFETLQKKFLNIPSYPVTATSIKIPAGWLIEQIGFKGKRFGATGVHEKQALVLVNYGGATGKEIVALANKIQEEVFKKFNIALEIEVNVV